ncbi:MAG TPA: hypothetical protein VH969_04815 [Actinophytocola sp.]|jgi:NAD(P)-dependent dehydrogenase (short-subunit alcohol dehydrogenase family)|uniref:hypothetical protein n=1 Tax=Actinophytocola sp. TaxID=1872138 RepID=UPI002F93A5C0
MDIHDTVAVGTGAGVGSGLAIAERALAERAELGEAERSAIRPPVPLSRLCEAVVELVVDENAADRVVVLERLPA